MLKDKWLGRTYLTSCKLGANDSMVHDGVLYAQYEGTEVSMKIDMTCYCGSRFQLDTSDEESISRLTLPYNEWQRVHAPHTPVDKPLPWTPVSDA